jgi:endonuclease/exonuclease/phosphatase family metal-dependent hydrolase
MSFNIRYNNINDGENSWQERKEELKDLVLDYNPDFIGIQEGLYDQVSYIDSCLINYSYIGVGRDDGKKAGEYSPVFYDTSMYQMTYNKTIWLSKTPEKVSVGWDASMERICSYGVFSDKQTGKNLYVFNTHFDHLGKKARKKSASTIISVIENMGISDSSIILMGDLNSTPNEPPIKKLSKYFNDPVDDDVVLVGPQGTFNGFDPDFKQDKRIDYIFFKNLFPISYSHIDQKRENNLFISDHFPVLAKFNINSLY